MLLETVMLNMLTEKSDFDIRRVIQLDIVLIYWKEQ